MKNTTGRAKGITTLASLAVAAFILSAPIAFAGSADVERSGKAGSFKRHTERTATQNGVRRSSQITGEQGKTASRAVAVDRKLDNSGRDKAVSVTGADGQTHERVKSVSRQPTESGMKRDVNGTNFKGEDYSKKSTIQHTENGAKKDVDFVGINGQTSNRKVDYAVDKEAGTYSKDITVTRPEGQSQSRSVIKTYGENGQE